MSAVAPHFAVLAVAQAPIGVGVGLTYAAAVAAVADWSRPEERSRVLAVALLGPPLAWVFGMPIAGAAVKRRGAGPGSPCRSCWRSPGW